MAKRWTEEEAQYLHDNIGIENYTELSKNLGRSNSAIKQYRHRNHLPTFHNGDFYTYSSLSKELGKSRSTLRKYYNKGRIKGRRCTWSCKWGKYAMMFLEKDIISFLKKFYYLFDFHKMQPSYFRHIVIECYENER